MPGTQHEGRLVARAKQGDRNAFGELYESYLDELYRYVFYRVNNQADAEDLTEQVFLKAWEKLSLFRAQSPFRAWLYRIARNTVIDHYRTRKEEVPLDEGDITLTAQEPMPEEWAISQENRARLTEALLKLSPLQQDVLIMRFISGHDSIETARILEKSVGAVRVIQHRALKALLAYLPAGEIIDG